jgi:alpha-mannosidase
VLPHPGSLPKQWGFLEITNPNVVVSSLKPSREGDVALRVYEASGRPAQGVTMKLKPNVLSASEANLLEDAGSNLKLDGKSVRVDLHPFEIKTIRLRLGNE